MVRDLGSRNGTFLNGLRVGRAGERLRKNDFLQFGDLLFKVSELEVGSTATAVAPAIVERSSVLASWNDISTLIVQQQPGNDDLLLGLVRTGRSFAPNGNLKNYIESIVWKAAELVRAESATAYLSGEDKGDLSHVSTLSFNSAAVPQAMTLALARNCLAVGRSLLCQGETDQSSFIALLLRRDSKKFGVLCFARSAAESFTENDLRVGDALALSVSSSVESLKNMEDTQRRLFVQTLNMLMRLVRMRDDHTGDHAQRVTDYALLLGDELGLGQNEKDLLRMGGPLHELGKIGIPDAILRKQSGLTDVERLVMADQVLAAAQMVSEVPQLMPILPIVRNIHERWDGTGYPDRLAGEGIPILARVIAIADAFDAMTSDWPYRRALSTAKAFTELEANAGTQFDPRLIAAFLRLQPRVSELMSMRKTAEKTLSAGELRELRGLVGTPS